MKITCVETITLARGITVHAGPIRWLWLRLHTDAGLIGLGETYPFPEAEAGVIHGALARILLGQDPSRIDWLWREMHLAVSYAGWAGAEIRAISAVDMALWDLAGKVAGQPLYQLLGGASRERIPTYNTCYDHLDFHREPERLAGVVAGVGHPRDEDLAVRPRGAAQRRPAHYGRGDPGRSRAARTHPPALRPDDGRRHGIPRLLEPGGGAADRAALEPLEPMWLEEMLPQDNLAAV